MQAIRNVLRATPQFAKTAIPKRDMSVIATPPRNKVSSGEVIVLSGMMLVGWLAIPAWVLVNIKNYRSKE